MGRPKGTGGTGIRWKPPRELGAGKGESGTLFIGRAIWQQIGSPGRVTLRRRADDRVEMVPTRDPRLGYAVNTPLGGQPRLRIGREMAARLHLEAGTYTAEVAGDSIVF